ncbi:hypothetical protein BJY00DRAFT_129409 [Aspergillus carlsbadensis]|nr:hypothetical protein BJY00DRAFT_129409 [Aspergillus carlsbadensis]
MYIHPLIHSMIMLIYPLRLLHKQAIFSRCEYGDSHSTLYRCLSPLSFRISTTFLSHFIAYLASLTYHALSPQIIRTPGPTRLQNGDMRSYCTPPTLVFFQNPTEWPVANSADRHRARSQEADESNQNVAPRPSPYVARSSHLAIHSSRPRRAVNNSIAHLFTPPTTLDDKQKYGYAMISEADARLAICPWVIAHCVDQMDILPIRSGHMSWPFSSAKLVYELIYRYIRGMSRTAYFPVCDDTS